MKKFTLLNTSTPNSSHYIHLQRIHYLLDDQTYSWDMYRSFDSVAILLYLKTSHSILFLRHLRPCAFLRDQKGIVYELCAGLVDKEGKSIEEIAREEILEECGYDIPTERLQKINTFFSNIGISTAKQTLFFATISQEERIAEGGGERDENFELFELPCVEIENFLNDHTKEKTSSLAYMLEWFLRTQNENHA